MILHLMSRGLKPLTILVSGPYRSGTGDDPALMKANLRKLEDTALKIFRAGHIPIIYEWFSLPLPKVTGFEKSSDKPCYKNLYPISSWLILKCDAILRLPGESTGADCDVMIARQNNIPVYYKLDDILNL